MLRYRNFVEISFINGFYLKYLYQLGKIVNRNIFTVFESKTLGKDK